MDFKDKALEEQYYEYQTQQDLRASYRGLFLVTGFFAIVGLVNLWIWCNILYIEPFYGKLRYLRVQAKSGLLLSTFILIYTLISFLVLRYLLVYRLGIDSVSLDMNLTQIRKNRTNAKSKTVLAIKILKIVYFILLGCIYSSHHAPTFGPTLKLIDLGLLGSKEVAEKILATKRWPAIAVDFL